MKKNNTLLALGLLTSASAFAAEKSYNHSSYPYGTSTITTGSYYFPYSGQQKLINPGYTSDDREITRVQWSVGFENDSSLSEKVRSTLYISGQSHFKDFSIQGRSAAEGPEFIFTDTNSSSSNVLTVGDAYLYLVTRVTENVTYSLKHQLFNYEVFYVEIPKNVYAAVSNGNTVTIDWDDAEGANHYIREVSVNWMPFKNATRFDTSQATYFNQANANFRYRVKSCDSQNYCGSWSEISHGVTIEPELDIPQNVEAQVTGRTINITWDAVTGTEYYIRDVSVNDAEWKNGTKFTTNSATYYNQAIGSTFIYRVKACNASDECTYMSTPSEPVTVY
jgi:hypothetical protein